MAQAEVLYDYDAQDQDEISMRQGDVINSIRLVESGWYEGRLGGLCGIFPCNFVKYLGDPPERAPLPPGRKCRVLYSYDPVNEDELALVKGDVIQVLEEVEEGWWRGSVKGTEGVFPSNFVYEIREPKKANNTARSISKSPHSSPPSKPKHLTGLVAKLSGASPTSTERGKDRLGPSSSLPQSPLDLPPKPQGEKCRVTFPYEAQNEDELTLREGELVNVLDRNIEDVGWWKGEVRGKVGVFPNNFVELLVSSGSSAVDGNHHSVLEQETKRATKVAEATGIKLPGLDGIRAPGARKTSPASLASTGSCALNNLGARIKRGSEPTPGRSTLMTRQSQEEEKRRTPSPCPPPVPPHADVISDLDIVSSNLSSQPLSHPNANRGKGPKRRPPSTLFPGGGDGEKMSPPALVNGDSESAAQSSSTATSPISTATKEKGEKRPPWFNELRHSKLFQDGEKPALPPVHDKPAVPSKKPVSATSSQPPNPPLSKTAPVKKEPLPPPKTDALPTSKGGVRSSPPPVHPKKESTDAPPAPASKPKRIGAGDEISSGTTFTSSGETSEEMEELRAEVKRLRSEMESLSSKMSSLVRDVEKERSARLKLETQVRGMLKS